MLNFLIGRRKKIVIFGTGSGGVTFFNQQKYRFNVLAFVDNNPQKQGVSFLGRQVYSPEKICALAYDKIIIASDYHVEIYHQLVNELKLPAEKIALFHEFKGQSSIWCDISTWWQKRLHRGVCSDNRFVAAVFFRLAFPTDKSRKGLRVVPISWLDKSDNNRVLELKAGAKVKISGPCNIDGTVSCYQVLQPAIALYHFDSVLFTSISRSVLSANNKLVMERVISSAIDKADYAGGQVVYHSSHRALVRVAEQPVKLESGILINGVSETNYYHWLLEILSQLYFLKKLPADYAALPVLLSVHAQRIPAVATILKTIALPQQIIYLESVTTYQVKSLYLINSPSLIVTNFKNTAECQLEDYYADADALQFIREIGLQCATAEVSQTPKRIFLARKQSLRAYNQQEIWQLLADYGFAEVYLEDLSFVQQVSLIKQAEYIVGPTGAAWSNLLFATSGTKALCWMPAEYGDFACFSHLATLFDVQLDYIRYHTGINDSRELYYHRYNINVDAVRAWLEQLD